jgi:hypothetical protein
MTVDHQGIQPDVAVGEAAVAPYLFSGGRAAPPQALQQKLDP